MAKTKPLSFTLDGLRLDALKYMNLHNITQREMSYLIGCDASGFNKFLNHRKFLHSRTIINLINLLYYDTETENSI